MALGDPTTGCSVQSGMLTRLSNSSVANRLDELAEVVEEADESDARQNRDAEASSSSSVDAGGAVTSLAYLPQTVFLCEPRPDPIDASRTTGQIQSGLVSKWRHKDRMKTGCVALVLCLNISVDPPDVIKISPCARMECWIDPFLMAAPKALETIGKALHAQYERWQPRAKYKLQLDPTVDEVKKLCNTCRKYGKSERVVFHYNGHGVPKPTANGEIWVFNKSYTQYIPLPIADLDSWLQTPSLYVFDCSAAGMVVNAFSEYYQRQDESSVSTQMKDIILLAACEAHETLPQSVEFPADVFTSCLTTPIKMALRWFCSRSLLRDRFSNNIIDKIPGRQNDRKTPLGELNWIFTAVTDTIAWNVLPHDLFQRLFRQDLLVASLFRNFLLAERVMRSAKCSPISFPLLPSTHQHHMWDAWDMAAEICLSQLPTDEESNSDFQPSPFFTEQLTAFELWLEHGSEHKRPPEQLPIVLQVLLSQSHRFRALVLLGKFLDMGSWAVDLALSVGIFPYVLKLLQTTTLELRQILVFIWTKILALDKSCQVDLVKDGGHKYFINFLDSLDAYPEQRAMAAFVLAVVVDGHRNGQEACVQANVIQVCMGHLNTSNSHDAHAEPLLIQWLCLCLGKLWEDFPEAQVLGLQQGAPSTFERLLTEPQPEVRAAAVFGLGTLLDVGSNSLRDRTTCDDDYDDDEKSKELNIVQSLFDVVTDGSPLVRAEVAVALGRFALGHNRHLKSIAAAYWKTQSNSLLSALPSLANIRSPPTGYPSSSPLLHSTSIISSQISPILKVGNDIAAAIHDGKASASSPHASSGIMHGSPLSDNSSERLESSILLNDLTSNGILGFSKQKTSDNMVYSHCVMAVYALAKDPYPRIAGIGRRVLSMIGIERVPMNTLRPSGGIIQQNDAATPTPPLAGLARSSSWFDMNTGRLQMAFRTPPVSPPQQNYLTGMRRVCSLEFRPHQLNPAEPGILGSSADSECSLLPQSSIYNWSAGHFSRPLLTSPDDDEEALSKRDEKEKLALDCIAKCQRSSINKLSNQIASWDIRSESGIKSLLLQPFSPIVIAADECERIRVWNHEETVLLNSFENHSFPEKGIAKLCLLNELDDSLLLVGSYDGSIRIWRDYTQHGSQKLVSAFSSIQCHRPGARSVNAVVDWQQLSGYLYASGEVSSVMVWDLDKEQRLYTFSSLSGSSISALSASQVRAGHLAAGYADGWVRLFDVRTAEKHISTMRPHTQSIERVVGISFQPGLDSFKIVSASQAGDIQFLDTRKPTNPYLTIEAHRKSLSALAVHRHAPIIASGSARQMIKVFNLEREQLSVIRYHPSLMPQMIGPVNCLSFHPYKVVLAAGTGGPTDACVSIHTFENIT